MKEGRGEASSYVIASGSSCLLSGIIRLVQLGDIEFGME
jgi:hypothetical protein